ncbi:hypothetical protein H206_06163 [Candidatus Electrothrix aarhusensis]|uniref:Uncharacterized protein n=1 Tax=Candidatus Electrothrix aarhusensis TaxID=1859131 RepID=A0A3S3SQ85_9BACT|nr:hypothetical protein H206_06163 [Candidatus Electrothrix aarhusensis]
MAISSKMAIRPAMGIKKTAIKSWSLMEARQAIFRERSKTKAITPIAPDAESRMISSIRSRGRELKKPSAVSASPSKWSPPEKERRMKTVSTAVTAGGRTWLRHQVRGRAMHPKSNPTKGKKGTARDRSSLLVPKLPANGIIERKRRAATKEPIVLTMLLFRSWPGRGASGLFLCSDPLLCSGLLF